MIPYVTDTPDIRIPANLLPADGRFGSGPSKVRPEAVEALAAVGRTLPRHQPPPEDGQVGGGQPAGRAWPSCSRLPDGYEVVLGNGGTTCFWDAATFGLIERKSQHLSFGEFSSKFATAAADAPHLDDPEIIASEVGTHPLPVARDDVDLYALTHNETSTGVMMPIRRPDGRRPPGRRAAAWWPWTPPRAPGACRVDPDAVRRLLLRPAEVLRLRRRAVGGPPLPGRRRTGSPPSPPPSGGCRPRWT